MKRRDDRQLPLPLEAAPSPTKLRVIEGLGQKPPEVIASRDDVARVLMEAGADMLLRRISSDRAEEIEQRVDEILDLFDQVDRKKELFPVLQGKLDELESLMRETRSQRKRVGRR